MRGLLGRVRQGLRRALRLVARPVRVATGRGNVVIQPYRGYGSRRGVLLLGRVFRQPPAVKLGRGTLLGDWIDVGRRILRWGLGDAELSVRFAGLERTVRTDPDGYFRVELELGEPPPSDHLWHSMELELTEPEGLHGTARGQVFIPPERARLLVISDIDDTVVHTGVANVAKMMWRLFVQKAHSRVAFPGVAAFYRSLYRGASGDDRNPLLYVSRGPWSIYEVLVEFFRLHEIPVGPILFLREWGLTVQRPLPVQAKGHKVRLVREMMERYPDLPLILIGDSGQRDPEVYAEVVREHPERVRAVYIREVGDDPERREGLGRLAEELEGAGSELVVAADTFVMAEHAARRGFITEEALAEVLEERARDVEKEEAAQGASPSLVDGIPDVDR